MPSIYDLKPAFQGLLRPLTGALARRGVTPNQVTLAGVALSGAAGALVAAFPAARWPLVLLAPVLVARMALNAIDGMLAREHGKRSALGAVLNELGDVVADAALYLPLGLVPGFDAGLVVGVVVLAIVAEMAGVVCAQIGASRRYDGPLGKSDRAFVFGGVALLVGAGVPPGGWVRAVLVAMLVLLGVTVFQRARNGLRELEG